MPQINGWIAFTGGLFSFFSPCVLPIIPAYIGILTGNEEQRKRKRLIINGLGFMLGFSIIFILLGVTATLIGQLLLTYKFALQRVGGAIVVFFGLVMTGIIKNNMLKGKGKKNFIPISVNFTSSIAMGMAFSLAWTPCIGMVLATILILAGTTAPSTGAYLLLLYSLGFAIPFLLVALVFQSLANKLTPYLPIIQKIGGVFLIILGIAIFTDQLYFLSRIVHF